MQRLQDHSRGVQRSTRKISVQKTICVQRSGNRTTLSHLTGSLPSRSLHTATCCTVRAIGAGALNATPSAKTLTGTVSANTPANNTWTGAGGFSTGFGTATPLIVIGQKLSIGGTNYTVNSITNTSVFTTTTGISANVVANTIATYGVLVKNPDHYDGTFSLGVSGYGAFVGKYAGDLGNSLKYSVCASAAAFAQTTLTGSISLTLGSNVVTGTTTAFSTELVVGDLLTHNGVSYPIASIANTTQLTLNTSAQVTATAASGQWGRKWEFASLFDRAPGVSNYVSTRGGATDELHLVVVDIAGQHTGVPGTVLERYAFLSKANNAKNANGENNYYAEVVNRSLVIPLVVGYSCNKSDELGNGRNACVRNGQPLNCYSHGWTDRQRQRWRRIPSDCVRHLQGQRQDGHLTCHHGTSIRCAVVIHHPEHLRDARRLRGVRVTNEVKRCQQRRQRSFCNYIVPQLSTIVKLRIP
jgi:hypothetical protein